MDDMLKVLKGLLLAAVLLVLLAAGSALVLQQWLRSEDFRDRMERLAGEAVGAPVRFGELTVDLWPLPAIAADQVRLFTRPALTLARVELRPRWRALLAGRVEIATLVVREAVLPQEAIAALAAGLRKRAPVASGNAEPRGAADRYGWPDRAVLERVTWIDSTGRALTFDAQAQLGADGLVDAASFEIVGGRFAGARGETQRASDHWPIHLHIGGGRITGKLRLQSAAAGVQSLQGEFQARGVEVSALTAPSRSLTGKIDADTRVRAQFREWNQLPEALASDTRFTVREAVVHGLDLVRVAQGRSGGGETELDTLTGQLATRGRTLQLSQLVARARGLSAQGQVTMGADRKLSGRIVVDLALAPGTLGIPLVVGGTADAPSVKLSRGALVGAALGATVAPGPGTAAGVRVGDHLGERLRTLFK